MQKFDLMTIVPSILGWSSPPPACRIAFFCCGRAEHYDFGHSDIPAKELAKESDRPKPREAVKRDNDNWLFKGKKVTTLT
jgi:hypothetical protein